MASSTNYRCSLCGFQRGTVPLPNKHRVCMRCMALAIGKLQDAVYQNRPTHTDMNEAIDKAMRPLAARVTALESQFAALCEVLDGRARIGVLPYAKSKAEAARELFRAGKTNKEVGVTLGLEPKQVKVIKCRMKDKPPQPEIYPNRHWRDLREGLAEERGELCEACRENFETKLRRITFERGDFPTKDDVKFLCDPCHDALKPIPFYEEFIKAGNHSTALWGSPSA